MLKHTKGRLFSNTCYRSVRFVFNFPSYPDYSFRRSIAKLHASFKLPEDVIKLRMTELKSRTTAFSKFYFHTLALKGISLS